MCGLISVNPIKQRRPRKNDESALRNHSYSYKVRVVRDGSLNEIPICQKAFVAIHGITNQRICTLRKSLSCTGHSPIDQRGKHKNRRHAMPPETIEKVHAHIKSLKGRTSHYSLHESSKIYLPEELSVKRLHSMYQEMNPDNPVSYEYYRLIFTTKFNISFGYPRSDTCSNCDSYQAKVKGLEHTLSETKDQTKVLDIEKQLKSLKIENEVHLRKANTFYRRKTLAKKKSRQNNDHESVCFDYMKNLPCPNIATNDSYYRRKLGFFMFNVHVLSTNEVIFYTYNETTAKKGADDVASLLYHFCSTILDQNVRHLELFWDSCAGQNKNYTMLRLLHAMVHKFDRFDSIKVTFPQRGHSYMECDKDMGLIKQNVHIEVPSDWNEHVRNSRSKPSPFTVIEAEPHMFSKWGSFLTPHYKQKCPFATRPITEIFIDKSIVRTINGRSSYNGAWESYIYC